MPSAVDENAPDAGDLLWLDLGEPIGREQGGRRPALVVTPREYNVRSSLLIVCPITRTTRNWPFQVALPPNADITGFVLADQIKVIDPRRRAFRKGGCVPPDVLARVRGMLAALLGIPVSN